MDEYGMITISLLTIKLYVVLEVHMILEALSSSTHCQRLLIAQVCWHLC